jgi:hypothetical protein
MHEARGGLIDHHEERVFRGATLEPIVRATVDLDEFSKSCATLSELVDDCVASTLRLPQPLSDHQAAHALDAESEAMNFVEFFAGERRAARRSS